MTDTTDLTRQKKMAALSEAMRAIVIERKASDDLRASDVAAAVVGVLADVFARAYLAERWDEVQLYRRYDNTVAAGRASLRMAIVASAAEQQDAVAIRRLRT